MVVAPACDTCPVTRRERLNAARLYLVTPLAPGGRSLEALLTATLAEGVDIVQLRDKGASDAELLAGAAVAHRLCTQAGALFILNDRPDLAARAEADGVHLGQDDMPVDEARALLGPDPLIGLSTHSPADIDRVATTAAVDYIGVGPVHATPTKPGRAAVGLELVEYATAHAVLPWFAIGGVDPDTMTAVIDAGAERVALVRAITDAPDPGAAARALRLRLTEPAAVSHG